MSQVLGRGEHQPWATKWPVSSLGAMLITAVVGIGIFTYCNTEMWTPLQQWYWVQYLNTKSFPTARGDYKLLTTVDAHGAADDGRCRRGTGTDARMATVSVCPHAESAAEGSGHAEGGHCALHECANEPDAFGADLRGSDSG